MITVIPDRISRLAAAKSVAIETLATEPQPIEKAGRIVQYLYYVLAFQALAVLNGREAYLESLPQENFTPLWPIAWAQVLPFRVAVNSVILLFVITALAGAFLYWHRLGRIAAFLGVFQLHALLSSFVQVDHHWYPWLYVTFLFMLLPDIWKGTVHSLEARKKFLLIFFSAQLAMLSIYSLAGAGKVYGAISQMLSGQVHAFSPEALALHIASWLSTTGSTSFLGPFVVRYPWVGWPFLVGSIYVLFFSTWIAFRPSLHKLWATAIILYHLGIYLTMGELFLPPTLLLLFLFFDSPFRAPRVSWQEMARDLPLLGWGLKHFCAPKGNVAS